jgi:hypothetical protein
MSLVELRNQNRGKTIRMIRALLLPGDMMLIKDRSGKSYRSVTYTLDERQPLYSQAIIDAAIAFLKEKGRLAEDFQIPE